MKWICLLLPLFIFQNTQAQDCATFIDSGYAFKTTIIGKEKPGRKPTVFFQKYKTQGVRPDRALVHVWASYQQGNLYLFGTGMHKEHRPKDSIAIISGAPTYSGKVEFIFVDGESYTHEPNDDNPHASFTIMLKGSKKIASNSVLRRIFGSGRLITGDTVLLGKLIAKPIHQLIYSQSGATYIKDGKTISLYDKPMVIDIHPRESQKLLQALKCLAQ